MPHPTPSNRQSFASLPHDFCDDATCTTHHCSFAGFEAKLGNPRPSCFTTKQDAICRLVSSHRLYPLIGFEAQTDKPHGFDAKTKKLSQWFWGTNHQTVDRGFEFQTKKSSQWFWGQTTDKLSPPVLRLNWEICTSRLLHVYDAGRTWRHPTSRSSDHWVPDLCLIIPDPPHKVSYSYLDPRHCPPCCIRHLHIMRQANMFLHTE
jgi:hypothetical protein